MMTSLAVDRDSDTASHVSLDAVSVTQCECEQPLSDGEESLVYPGNVYAQLCP